MKDSLHIFLFYFVFLEQYIYIYIERDKYRVLKTIN